LVSMCGNDTDGAGKNQDPSLALGMTTLLYA